MAVYNSIQELKNAINDTIYQNDAGLITAEILQERLHDMIDTLDAIWAAAAGIPEYLENSNELTQILVGEDKVATEEWVAAQGFGTEAGSIPLTQKGAAYGVAELDANGLVPSDQLPTVANAGKLTTTNFTIEESVGALIIKYGATVIASISSAGYLKVKDDFEFESTTL